MATHWQFSYVIWLQKCCMLLVWTTSQQYSTKSQPSEYIKYVLWTLLMLVVNWIISSSFSFYSCCVQCLVNYEACTEVFRTPLLMYKLCKFDAWVSCIKLQCLPYMHEGFVFFFFAGILLPLVVLNFLVLLCFVIILCFHYKIMQLLLLLNEIKHNQNK